MNARDEILGRLKAAPKTSPPARPPLPEAVERLWSREQTVEEFVKNLEAQTAVVHHIDGYRQVSNKLTEIIHAENIERLAVTTDDVIERLDLETWAGENHIEILRPEDSPNRNDFKNMIFDRAQASLTGVDFAVAESGTICIAHRKDQPRLLSLAPIMHIALVPIERLYPVYEDVVDRIFSSRDSLPSQVTFITGPSMTADIQGVPFKGMHGPKKLTVLLIG